MPDLLIPRSLGRDDVYVVRTLDGSDTLFSREYNTTYHSTKGAVSESRHVFIQAGLASLAGKDSIRILEFGFGTGLNAFLAFLFSEKYHTQILYTGIETSSIDLLTISQLNYPEYLVASDYRELFFQMHQTNSFSTEQFHFRKCMHVSEAIIPEGYDIIFYDAFSPDDQAECWSAALFETLSESLVPGGKLVTYCAQGEVRRRLTDAGFSVERLPGAPGKRHMLRGVKRI